jgi:pimeloyl-ACP methyl ester carboxylesterase
MDRLDISRAPLIGHSMGGTVSLSVAVQDPQRVSKLVVVGSPIVGSSLAFSLKMAGRRLIAAVLFNMMWAFRMGMRVASPFICQAPRFLDMMDKDLSRTTVESFLLSNASLRRTDLRPILSQVNIPAMGMYGDKDIIVHPDQWQPMLEGIPHTRVERFAKAGHFIPARTIESDVVLFATHERRIIDRDVKYDDSDHYKLKDASKHPRLYPRRGEKGLASW